MNEPFFNEYLERLSNLLSAFQKEMQALPAQAVDWTPGPETNSAAVLLAHTAGSLRYWIGDVALGEPSNRDRPAEFRTRGVAGAELLKRLEAVIGYAQEKLPRLQLSDLAAETAKQRGGQPVTRAWALLHALEHGYLHLGHIQLTCQLWRQSHP